MTIFRAENFWVGWLLAVALSVSIGPAAGQTYTPEQEQACTGDAFRLCSSEIPDISRVTACMVAKKVPALAGVPVAVQAGSRAERGRSQAGWPADGHPARNAAQGRERQGAQGQEAGETRDLTARAT